MTSVRLEPAAPMSRVKHSTTEPLGSLVGDVTEKNTHAYTCTNKTNPTNGMLLLSHKYAGIQNVLT